MSRAAQSPSVARAARRACAHCGLELSEGQVLAGEQFCCAGCRQVHHILHEIGLSSYYDLRTQQGEAGRPATVTGRRYDDFDEPGLLESHARPIEDGTQTIRLYLEGIHCAACVWLVEELPHTLDGLLRVRLNFATSVVTVQWDPAQVSLSRIARSLDSIGYAPHIHRHEGNDDARRGEDRSLLIKIGVAGACAMNIMFIHLALYAGQQHGIDPHFERFFRWMSLALSVPVVFYSARPFFKAAYAGLVRRVAHMDLPIALALSSAFSYSAYATISGTGPIYFDSLAALVALLLGARFIQQRAQRAALDRTESLRGIAFVEFARRLDGRGISVETQVSTLSAGDRIEVRSGDLIAVDGMVTDGHSSIDNAVLTGEPDAVAVAPGDFVHAGASNLGARLVVEVRATGSATRIGALLAMVEDAMARRAPIVQLADRISRSFVLAVIVLAAVAGAVAYYRGAGNWGETIEQVVALLVVTCPCALGLATPVAMTVGLARAARAGIFIKDPDSIELLQDARTIVLDKTGTLTMGTTTLASWDGDERTLAWARALEAHSNHPVALALCRTASSSLRPVHRVQQVRERIGLGIHGLVDGHPVAVGNRALMDCLTISLPEELNRRMESIANDGLSPVLVAVQGVVCAVAGIGDRIRHDTRETIEALRKRGLRLIILSGDHPKVVSRVAADLQIAAKDAHGGMTPEAKCDFMREAMQAAAHGSHRDRLVMVGDGVNDAAALALADVGIVVDGGTGACITAASVVLTRPGLAPLTELFGGSRSLLGIIHRNLGFSLAYNLLGAGLAIGGLVGPLLAALLMPVSSLTVIFSSVLGRSFAHRRGTGRS